MELLDYLGVARFEGEDAQDFLQAQLSADIAALEPGGAGFACYCSPKGQVYGLLLVRRLAEGFQVLGAKELLPAMLNRLRMFVLRSKVAFSLQEPSLVYGLQPTDGVPSGDAFGPAGSDARYHVMNASGADEPSTGFKAFEITQRIVWLDANTTEKFIPQMLGYDQIGAVSFTKGCYPGQEIVARARYLGRVKRRPVVLSADIDFAVANGERLELRQDEGWTGGTVIDSARDSKNVTQLFIVTSAEPEPAVREFRIGEEVYRCATT